MRKKLSKKSRRLLNSGLRDTKECRVRPVDQSLISSGPMPEPKIDLLTEERVRQLIAEELARRVCPMAITYAPYQPPMPPMVVMYMASFPTWADTKIDFFLTTTPPGKDGAK